MATSAEQKFRTFAQDEKFTQEESKPGALQLIYGHHLLVAHKINPNQVTEAGGSNLPASSGCSEKAASAILTQFRSFTYRIQSQSKMLTGYF